MSAFSESSIITGSEEKKEKHRDNPAHNILICYNISRQIRVATSKVTLDI